MNESNEEILNKTFDDIKKEQKNKILPSVENFLIGTLGGLLIDYMRNGWPSSENINGFILRGIAGGFIVLAFYIVRMKKKCYDKWIDTQDEQIEILKEELRGKSSSYAINEDIEQNIIDFMCDIVENTDCVDAIQLHSYDIIPEGKNVIIPVQIEGQYLRQGKRHYLNAISNYYEIDKDIFTKFYSIRKNLSDKSKPKKEVLQDIENLTDDISKNKTEEHIEIYKLLLCIKEQIKEEIKEYLGNDDKSYEAKSDDTALQQLAAALEENMDNGKRTGILGGILYSYGYAYEYKKRNVLKEKRKYYSLVSDIELEKKNPVMITFILDTSLTFEDDFKGIIDNILNQYKSSKKKFGVGDEVGGEIVS